MNTAWTPQMFQLKNETRRTARQHPDYKSGRLSRSEFATNGCFGNLDGWIFNECAKGTVNGRSK